MKPIHNHAQSVKAKLLNLMRSSGKEYMYLLARYFNERFLYRVSISKYKNRLILKGGSLLYAIDGLNARPTVDIDFMGHNISRKMPELWDVIQEILNEKCEEDGVVFEGNSMESSPIAVDKKYPGARFSFCARMDSIVHRMSIDIGFGDIIIPSPRIIDFPLMISNLPPVNVIAYSVETVIAEKFHAMIDRDIVNSRMKDFFDCYILLSTQNISDLVLEEAVFATFQNRKLFIKDEVKLFSSEFYTDKMRLLRWKNFLKKIRWHEELAFETVMKLLKSRLMPLYEKYKNNTKSAG